MGLGLCDSKGRSVVLYLFGGALAGLLVSLAVLVAFSH